MTRDEAIIILKDCELNPCVSKDREAVEMAIKELEQEPCEDCISRQAVINAIANTCFWLSNDNWKELTKCINSISPVTPQPKAGKWIFKNDNITIPTGYYQCSECEKGKLLFKSNYCPNCGCKMIQEI